jgi:hypothetical protein
MRKCRHAEEHESLIATILAGALAFGAAGDIYRCTAPDGSVHFQDKPCAGARSTLLGTRSKSANADLMKLRQALKKLERSAPPATPQRRAYTGAVAPPPPRAHLSRAHWQNRGPANEALLAACSSQFFACAGENAARMDRCVAAIPRCTGTRASGCCPAECVVRYQDLRRAEFAPAQSVRDALLDDTVGSCAAR